MFNSLRKNINKIYNINIKHYSIYFSKTKQYNKFNKSSKALFSSNNNVPETSELSSKTLEVIKSYNSLYRLHDRAVISVTGQDAQTFLHSMITNDMNQFDGNKEKGAIAALFLNPKGRILYDALIIKSHLYLLFKKVQIKSLRIIGLIVIDQSRKN